jgi:hypothetical protein
MRPSFPPYITSGLLKVGKPKTWDDSKKDLKYIRQAGVRQFINTYKRVEHLKGDELLWGDEIEYGIYRLDHEQKKVRLSLRAKQVSRMNVRKLLVLYLTICDILGRLTFRLRLTYCARSWTSSTERRQITRKWSKDAPLYQNMEHG